MRQRRVKDLEERLLRCSRYIIDDPAPEKWQQDTSRPLFLEIGCGKGDFITAKAAACPSRDFAAIEGQESVVLRALEKAFALELTNLRFVKTFVHTMNEFFDENQLDGIYLNFSDPWPKARHYKRRLTYRGRLTDYAWAVKNGGFIEIKTDNEGLFEFTMEEIEALPQLLEIVEFTRDLHGPDCSYESASTMTEYEKKFHSAGKNINYVKVIVKKEK